MQTTLDDYQEKRLAGDGFASVVTAHFESIGFTVETSQGNTPEWDLKITDDAVEILIEVKFDLQCSKTGNVAFELSKPKKKGGLSATKSEFYVQGYADKRVVHVIEVAKLKELCAGYESRRMGNSGNAVGVLVPYDVFAKHAEELFSRDLPSRGITQERLAQLKNITYECQKQKTKS